MSDEKSKEQAMQQHTTGRQDATPLREPPALPPEVQGPIGKQLRQVYAQMLAEPLPDKFVDLLSKLSKAENEK